MNKSGIVGAYYAQNRDKISQKSAIRETFYRKNHVKGKNGLVKGLVGKPQVPCDGNIQRKKNAGGWQKIMDNPLSVRKKTLPLRRIFAKNHIV